MILFNCLKSELKNEFKVNLARPFLFTPLLTLLLLLPDLSGAQQRPDPLLIQSLRDRLNHADSFANRFEAEVWLLDMGQRLKPFIKDPDKRIHLLWLVHREATRANLSPELILALIQTESSFNRFAISPSGAQGLMQVMPFWKQIIGSEHDNLTNVETNLRYGHTILRHYLELEKGNMTRALARYNGSLGKNRYPNKVYKNWHRYWKRSE